MKRIILSSILVLTLCASMITGATFALFTSESNTNISATSGKVEVLASLEKAEKDWVYSPTSIDFAEGNAIVDAANAADVANGVFVNKGTATIDGATLKMNGVTPGDTVNLVIKVTNNSNVAIKYRVVVSDATGELNEMMDVTIGGVDYITSYKTAWTNVRPNVDIADIPVSVSLSTLAGENFESKDFTLSITLVAIQANIDVSEE